MRSKASMTLVLAPLAVALIGCGTSSEKPSGTAASHRAPAYGIGQFCEPATRTTTGQQASSAGQTGIYKPDGPPLKRTQPER